VGELILVLGGSRSGKTRLAESLATERGNVTYVATATLDQNDAEMVGRIERHRACRPEGWATLEVPRELESQLPALVTREGAVLIDCVTLWLTNLMLGSGGPPLDDEAILATVERTLRAGRGRARLIWVSNEVGCGIVPGNALSRRFADLQGFANQRIAAVCDHVYLSVAGIPVRIK
jgi:adenosylcobinamide kinase/adenosylcobinamide-phosphate guanylyltransferase